jgi:hypothetical protein
MLFLVKKIPWCNSQFFCRQIWSEVLAHFHAIAVKRPSSMRNRLFSLPRRVLCEQSLDIKEIDEHALDFAPYLSGIFRSR